MGIQCMIAGVIHFSHAKQYFLGSGVIFKRIDE